MACTKHWMGLLGVWWLGSGACTPEREAAEGTAPPAPVEAPRERETAVAAPPEPPTPPPAPAAEAKVSPARAGEEVAVPAGEVRLGTRPGSAGRNPAAEADAVRVQVPAFHIDRLPHPNDPDVPPTRVVDRKQAAGLCAKEGKRLCSEVEWERACQGEAGRAYPTRDGRWPAEEDATPCGEDGLACASGFGVLRMGTDAREWTSSDTTAGLGDRLRTAVVRGAASDAPAEAHRCAARDAATPDSRSKSLGFRCCRGADEAPPYPEVAAREPFELKPMKDAEARELLASLPEVAELAKDFTLFRGDDYEVALRKGGRSTQSILPWVPVAHPLVWSPVHGEQVWVLTGKSGDTALVLFLYVTQQGEPIFGGSFELEDEPDPIVVAFRPDRPEELLWSSCWGCGAEGGAISLREDGRVVIVQR